MLNEWIHLIHVSVCRWPDTYPYVTQVLFELTQFPEFRSCSSLHQACLNFAKKEEAEDLLRNLMDRERVLTLPAVLLGLGLCSRYSTQPSCIDPYLVVEWVGERVRHLDIWNMSTSVRWVSIDILSHLFAHHPALAAPSLLVLLKQCRDDPDESVKRHAQGCWRLLEDPEQVRRWLLGGNDQSWSVLIDASQLLMTAKLMTQSTFLFFWGGGPCCLIV